MTIPYIPTLLIVVGTALALHYTWPQVKAGEPERPSTNIERASFVPCTSSTDGSFYCGESSNSPERCLLVKMRRWDDRRYWLDVTNTCLAEVKHAYVLTKFLDARGRRIGVDGWQTHYLAPHEQIHSLMPTNGRVNGYARVEVRLITSDAAEAAH